MYHFKGTSPQGFHIFVNVQQVISWEIFLISNLCTGILIFSNFTIWHNNVSDKTDYIFGIRTERDRLYFLHYLSVIPSSRRTLTCSVRSLRNLFIYMWFLICKNVKKLPFFHEDIWLLLGIFAANTADTPESFSIADPKGSHLSQLAW